MMKKENVKKLEGIKKYDKFLLEILLAEHFSMLSKDDKNGYYGMAMVKAFLDGAKPALPDFACYLKINPLFLEDAFDNLRVNGIFNATYQIKSDHCINDNCGEIEWTIAKDRVTRAWCFIAGVASGLAGLKPLPPKPVEVVEDEVEVDDEEADALQSELLESASQIDW